MKTMIVVAHSLCDVDMLDHKCDFGAQEFAMILAETIPDSIVEIAPSFRLTCDLNERTCRNDPFRQKLRQLWQDEDFNLIIDLHSFPPTAEKWKGQEVAIFDSYLGNIFGQTLLTEGIQVAFFSTGEHDIIDEAVNYDIAGLVIKVNEILLTDPGRFRFIAKKVNQLIERTF